MAKMRLSVIQLPMQKWLQRVLLLGLAGVLSSCASGRESDLVTVKNTLRSFRTVVVDAGHGGKDNGAYRRYGGAEKMATLDVAQRLAGDLRGSGMHVVMTRSSDVFIELDERVRIGNEQKDAIFVSIHFNDSSRRSIHGFEVYYNSVAARSLADNIQQSLLTIPNSTSRGIKTARFRVLRNLKYPSVLVECGFLSNRTEGGDARDAAYRQTLADRIARAIVNARSGRKSYAGISSPELTASAQASPPSLIPARPRP